ncbi:hypothetical protein LDL59_16265 [Kaistella anthropi]|nr:hypothetical protein [Kaistella anthropi]
MVQPVSGFDSREFSEVISSSDGDFSSVNVWSVPGLKLYYGLSGLLSLVLAPLYVGLIYMANKYNFNQPLQVSDLFIGYKQNFLNIVLYSLVSSVLMGIAFMMCVIMVFSFFLSSCWVTQFYCLKMLVLVRRSANLLKLQKKIMAYF